MDVKCLHEISSLMNSVPGKTDFGIEISYDNISNYFSNDSKDSKLSVDF